MTFSSGHGPAVLSLTILALLSFLLLWTPDRETPVLSLQEKRALEQNSSVSNSSDSVSHRHSSTPLGKIASPTSSNSTSNSSSTNETTTISSSSTTIITTTTTTTTSSSSSSSITASSTDSITATTSTETTSTSPGPVTNSTSSSPTYIPSVTSTSTTATRTSSADEFRPSSASSTTLATSSKSLPNSTSSDTVISTSETENPSTSQTSVGSIAAVSTGFWANKSAVAGTFSVVALILFGLLVGLFTFLMKRNSRRKQNYGGYERYPEPALSPDPQNPPSPELSTSELHHTPMDPFADPPAYYNFGAQDYRVQNPDPVVNHPNRGQEDLYDPFATPSPQIVPASSLTSVKTLTPGHPYANAKLAPMTIERPAGRNSYQPSIDSFYGNSAEYTGYAQ